jgi:beta-phosphoglucomutase-like phosphatase (HAD superfamily)
MKKESGVTATKRRKTNKMIRTHGIEPYPGDIITPEQGREVDPFTDPEPVRLVAINLELAVRNLISARAPPECLVITADICTHKLMAVPTADGDVKVLVFDL